MAIARISDIKGLVTLDGTSQEILKNRDEISDHGGILTIDEFAKIIFEDGREVEVTGPVTFNLDSTFFNEGTFEESITQISDLASLDYINNQLDENVIIDETVSSIIDQNPANVELDSEQLSTTLNQDSVEIDTQGATAVATAATIATTTEDSTAQNQTTTDTTQNNTTNEDTTAADTDTNEALTLTVTPTTDAFVEDSTEAGATVATSSATDPDGGDITYSISDTTNYAIDAATGEVTLTEEGAAKVNAGEDLPNFTVTAESTSGQTSTDSADVNPADTDTNEALTLTVTPTTDAFVEDSTEAGATVATSSATDPDGGDITYSISDTTNYAIDAATGEVTLTEEGAAKVNAGEDLPNFTVTAESTSGQTSTDSADVNPADTDTNEALTLTVTPTTDAFVEDSTEAGATVATSSATDPDGGDITYSISDTTNYAIDAATGEVTLTEEGAAKVNAGEDLPNFTVTAESTSGQTSTDSADVNPADTDTNEALTLTVTPTTDAFVEDSTEAGATVATSSATDPDGGDITYSISDTTNYAIDAATGEVTLTEEGAAKVNAGEDLPNFTVTAESTSGQTSTDSADVNPADTDTNEALTLTVTPTTDAFVEDSTEAGATVATSSATDPDGGDITYSISDTTNYAIDAATGEVTLTEEGAAKVNAGEDLPNFTVTAESTSGQTSTDSADVNPADTDTNEALTLTVTPTTDAFVEDSTEAGATVATSSATDPDGGDITYSISDTTNYAIDAATGEVTLTEEGAAKVNAGEDLPNFTVTAESTSGQTSTDSADVNPADTDTNEALTLTVTPTTDAFVEDSTEAGATVATSSATDPDGGDITYSISDTTNYAIDAATGEVTLTEEGAAKVNAGEDLPNFTVTAESTSGQTSTDSADVNPADTDTNEALTLTVTPTTDAFVEDSTEAGATVATSSATDPDGGDITYSISDTTNYAIDAATGEVTLTEEGAAKVNAGEDLPNFTVTAESTSGQTSTDSADVNPADTDTNEALTLTVTPTTDAFVEDSTEAGATVATSSATDPDGGDITYSISDTTNYAIDAATGEVTLTEEGAAKVNAGEDLPNFTVTAESTSGQTSTDSADVNPADTDTNEALTLTVTPTTDAFVEDSTEAGATVATSSATDPDGGDITYSISDTTNYAIDAATGEVTLTEEGAAKVNAGEDLPNFTVTAESTSGQTSTDSADVNPADTDTNEALTLTVTPTTDAFVEDSTEAGATVATSSATDPDGGDITYSISDTTNYAIDAATGEVTLTEEGAAKVNAGEDLPNFTVTAESTSGQTSTDSADVNPADTDTNEALTLTVTPTTDAFVEDSTEAGATVATSSATDPDGGDITYSISDTTNYAIDAATGEVTLTEEGAAKVNAGEDLPNFTVTAESTSGQTSTDSADVNPADTDTNEALTLTVTPTTDAFVEDSTEAGATVATSSATDPDGGDITYSISDTTNYAIDAATGEVTLTEEGAAKVNAGEDLPNFTVTAESTSGQTSTDSADVNPADTDTNEALTLTVTPTTDAFVEDSTEAGATVATSSATDPDGGDITYSISDTTNYAIDAATGEVTLTEEGAAKVNAGEDLPNFTVTAESTSGQTSTDSADVNPADTDTNEALTLTVTPTTDAFVEDSTEAGATVATSSATDPDGGDITYSISDTTNYAIDAATGEVTLTEEGAAKVNAGEDLPNFTVTAESTSGQTSTDSADVNPADTDTNEALTLTVTPTTDAFVEDSTEAGATVATSSATDPDGGDITYSISDTTNYAIDAATGEVTLTEEGAAKVNAGEDLPNFTVTAESTSGQTSTDSADVNPADTDTNEALTLTVTPTTDAFVEDSTEAGATVATSSATDPDGGDITYSISDTTNYAIDAATGEVTLTEEGAAKVNAGEDLPNFTVTAESTSGQTSTDSADVNPADTDTNEALTLTVTPTTDAFVEDSTEAGATVATSSATDPDGGDITYSISDTTNYAIDAATGEVTLTEEGAAKVNAGEDLPNFTVTAESTSGQTSTDSADVNPADTDTNEALTLTVTPTTDAFVEDSTEAGATVATSSATDPDGGDITYSISDTTNYAIDAATGEVTLTEEGAAKVNAGEDLPNFTVTAESTSGQTSTDSADVNPADTDTNEALTLTVTPTTDAFVEDSTEAGATVATSSATDPDGGDITYSISDTTNYAIDAATGEVTLTEEGAAKVNAGEDLPNFTVTAESTSGQTSTDSADVNPADTDTNEALTLTVTPTTDAFVEDSTEAGATVATSSATDPDGGDITYSISDTTNYAIDAATGEVTLTEEGAAKVNAGEDLPNFTVTAESTSGQTSTDSADVNPADTDTNEALTLTVTPTTDAFVEDSTEAGATVATSSATDPDGGDITYSISDTTNYAIDAATGEVTLTEEGAAKVNAGEDLPNFTVTAESTSGQTSTDSADVNPADTDTNEALTLTVTPTTDAFVEDSTEAGATVATSSATDPDGGDITYSISDTTNYAIDAATGEVTLTEEGAAKVNAGEDLPNFTVTAESTSGQTSTDSADVNPADTTGVTTVSISTSNVTEDDTSVTFTIETSHVPQGAATAVVVVAGEKYSVDLNENGVGTLTLDTQDSDVYLDASTLTAEVTAINGGNFDSVSLEGAKVTANIEDSIDTTTVTITGTITTPSTIDVTNVTEEPNGINVYALDLDGNVQELSVVSGTNHDGFGVYGSTSGSGASSELGYGSNGESEKIVVDFDTEVKSIDVSFAWRNNTEDALVTFFDDEGNVVGSAMVSGGGTSTEAIVTYYDENGNITKQETAPGGSDKVDLEYTFEPGNGQTFSKIEFSAPGNDDDYLINKITYKEVLDTEVTDVSTTNAEVTLEIQVSNPPQGGTATAIVEVAGEEYEVQIDVNGRGTLNVEVPEDGDLTATVKEIIGGNYEAVDTSSASWDISSETVSLDDSITVSEDETYYLDSTDFGDNQVNVENVTITELPTNGTLYYSDGAVVETVVTNEGKEVNVYENREEITEGTTISMEDIAAGKVIFVPDSNSDTDGDFKFDTGDGIEHTVTINVDAIADSPTLQMSISDAVVVTTESEASSSSSNDSFDDLLYTEDGINLDSDYIAHGHKDQDLNIDNMNANEIDLSSGDDSISIKGSANGKEISTGSGDDSLVIGGSADGSEIDMGQGDDLVQINGNIGSSIDLGSGDDKIQLSSDSNVNFNSGAIVDGGSGEDTLYFTGSSTNYLLFDSVGNQISFSEFNTLNNNGTGNSDNSQYTIYEVDANGTLQGNGLIVKNIENIVFEGDSTVNTEESYQYTIDLNATLADTDGSETLSDITLTNIPDDTTLYDSNNQEIEANEDGSYTIPMDETGGDVSVTLISSTQLEDSSLNSINASITSSEENSDSSETTTVNVDGSLDSSEESEIDIDSIELDFDNISEETDNSDDSSSCDHHGLHHNHLSLSDMLHNDDSDGSLSQLLGETKEENDSSMSHKDSNSDDTNDSSTTDYNPFKALEESSHNLMADKDIHDGLDDTHHDS